MDIVLSILGLIGFIALTGCTGLFVAAEFALTGLERSTVDDHVTKKGDGTAKLLRRAHGELSFVLSGAQLGITITTLATGYLAEPILAKFFTPMLELFGLSETATGPIALILSLIIATGLSMVFGELVPKNLAIAHPLPTGRYAIRPVWVFNKVLSKFISALNNSANFIVRKLGVEPADELASARSPQELSALVRHSTGNGGFTAGKARVLDRSLKFSETNADDLMSPRSTVVTLDMEDTALDLIKVALETGHSRFPVTRGDLDDTIGVVHIKDALGVPQAERAHTSVSTLARQVPTIPASLGGEAVLARVRSAGSQLVLVADEYGGTAGIVTIEDVVEEIVGEVWDEHDNRAEDAEVKREGQHWEVSGLVRTDELPEYVGYTPPEGPYETLGGLLMQSLGRIPEEGDTVLLPEQTAALASFEAGGDFRWEATVISMDNRRVDRVRMLPVKKEENS
ncbi:hemolysin family protein [uncultured Corynebacterium sp.]|uniref:hemolysin family protein n=1 Tax=uncultured Corynebacterium sp. TaxID=159447 RepID=UPI002597D3B9|nr:hemolysin family protein [uncultured Corynebacterium sp.]